MKKTDHSGSLKNNEVKTGEYKKYFTFLLGKETYGIEVGRVREVNEFGRVFRVPRTTDTVRGVTNLRGDVIPVIDLSHRFYGRRADITILTSVVFIEIDYNRQTIVAGLMIDGVDAVVDIYADTLDTMPEYSARIRPDFISEIGKSGDDFIMILNLDNVLDIDEISGLNL